MSETALKLKTSSLKNKIPTRRTYSEAKEDNTFTQVFNTQKEKSKAKKIIVRTNGKELAIRARSISTHDSTTVIEHRWTGMKWEVDRKRIETKHCKFLVDERDSEEKTWINHANIGIIIKTASQQEPFHTTVAPHPELPIYYLPENYESAIVTNNVFKENDSLIAASWHNITTASCEAKPNVMKRSHLLQCNEESFPICWLKSGTVTWEAKNTRRPISSVEIPRCPTVRVEHLIHKQKHIKSKNRDKKDDDKREEDVFLQSQI